MTVGVDARAVTGDGPLGDGETGKNPDARWAVSGPTGWHDQREADRR